MALTLDELTTVRNALERAGLHGNYTKPQVNAALQAIDDLMTTQTFAGKTLPQHVSTAIDGSGVALSAAQKKALFAWWAHLKFERDK